MSKPRHYLPPVNTVEELRVPDLWYVVSQLQGAMFADPDTEEWDLDKQVSGADLVDLTTHLLIDAGLAPRRR